MQIRKGFAQISGGRLYYEMAGQGEPLVFISGGSSMDTRAWDDQLYFFSKYYQVACFDPRGMGKSDGPTAPFTFAEDVRELMDQLHIEKAHLVGHSFAGGVALDFALQHPDRVTSLVLVGAAASGFQFSDSFQKRNADLFTVLREKGTDEFVRALWADPHFFPAPGHPEDRRRTAPIIAENAARTLATDWSFVRPSEPPAMGRLAEVRVPVLVLVGELDHPEVKKLAELLAKGIKNARLVQIPGSGHTVNMEEPDAFNREVLSFLPSVRTKEQR